MKPPLSPLHLFGDVLKASDGFDMCSVRKLIHQCYLLE